MSAARPTSQDGGSTWLCLRLTPAGTKWATRRQGRDGLVTAMGVRGFATDELVDAGLAHRGANGRLTDFYCQRALIPIRDEESRVCGFVGRNIGDDRWPKYKNPPRTHAYDKSVNLYQPLPPPTAGSWGQVIVVEGTSTRWRSRLRPSGPAPPGQFCPVTQSGRELSVNQLEQAVSLNAADPGACIRWRRCWPRVGASPRDGSRPAGPCRVGHHLAG